MKNDTIAIDGTRFVLWKRLRTFEGAEKIEAVLIERGFKMGKDFRIYFPSSAVVGDALGFRLYVDSARHAEITGLVK
jgi:hypothetical protein